MIQLTDDGTMDTVLRCSECGAEMRYNYDPACYEDAETGKVLDELPQQEAYEAFVEWAIEDATLEHVCEGEDNES